MLRRTTVVGGRLRPGSGLGAAGIEVLVVFGAR
jgi:hypothetical protein